MIKQNNGNPIPILVMTSTIESEKPISVKSGLKRFGTKF